MVDSSNFKITTQKIWRRFHGYENQSNVDPNFYMKFIEINLNTTNFLLIGIIFMTHSHSIELTISWYFENYWFLAHITKLLFYVC